MSPTVTKVQDEATAAIFAALKAAFPELPDEPERVVYRYNPVAVRVRVISPRFAGMSMAEREHLVRTALTSVDPDWTEDITLLLMLAPDDTNRRTRMQQDFDHPTDWPV